MQRTIITCAVTGSIHTPSMSPYLPVSQTQIAEAALGAAEAGAAIIHLHARDPNDGRPSQNPDHFAPVLDQVKRNSDVVVNITTGGSPRMAVEERMRPAIEFQPELASLNMGSMNFGLFPMLKRFNSFQHEWEREALEASKDVVFKNTFRDVETALVKGRESGTRFEFECYDVSHLENLRHFHSEGLASGQLLIQTVFGVLGGIGSHPEDVMHMRRTADRNFADGYEWSVLGAGRNQMRVASMGAAMGAHVRVGLEDSLWLGRGKLAQDNAAQVGRAKTIVEALDQEVATPDDARQVLRLKGKDAVGF